MEVVQEFPAPISLCPPQIPHGLSYMEPEAPWCENGV